MSSNPPRALKSRVMRSLRDQRFIDRARPAWVRPLVAAAGLAAAALLLLVWPRGAGDDHRPAFLLLLYEDSSFVAARPGAELVAEYGAWAAQLRRDGNLVLGEKLDDEVIVLQTGGTGGPAGLDRAVAGRLTGLFVIRAMDRTAALVLARSCPHLRYGGRVVVRPVSD